MNGWLLMMRMQEYAEVEDLLDGFDLTRREHITYMLRLEQDRPPLSIAALNKSAAGAGKVHDGVAAVSCSVIVFSAKRSALLDIESGSLPEDMTVMLDPQASVGGGRQAMHLIAGYSDDQWATSALNQLCSLDEGRLSCCHLIVSGADWLACYSRRSTGASVNST